MAAGIEGSAVVDRPVEEVFAFLADGSNDPKFSPRVQEIEKVTDGPPGVGTVYKSTVKDAGMTTQREFEITEFEGHGFGKLILPLALRGARKDADPFAQRIKEAIEAS